jgi:hypothetical protein
MNTRILGLGLVVLAFGALSEVALAEFGVVGLFAAGNANWATRQIFVDLVIALFVATGFMIRDAREHGLPWVPYAIATLLTGSFGPLAYLIHRELALRPALAGERAQARS